MEIVDIHVVYSQFINISIRFACDFSASGSNSI